MKPKALFVSPFFYPEAISTGKWNTNVADELAMTYDLTVLCSHPLYPEWKVSRTDEKRRNIEIVRCGLWVRYPSNSHLRRAVLEISFYLSVLKFLIGRRKSFETVIGVFPPCFFMFALGFIKAKRIGIVHDVMGVFASAKQGYVSKAVSKIVRFIEKKSFQFCDRIIFLSKEMKNYAVKEYCVKDISSSIAYPFVTIDSFDVRGELDELLPINKKNIVYSGALGEKQAPQELLNLISELSIQDSDVCSHVFSAGPIFEKKSSQANLSSIKFHPLVKERLLPELLKRSDVQILPQKEGTSSGSLPSKLPNILASGAKLFVITDKGSELSKLLAGVPGVCISCSWDLNENLGLIRSLLAETEPDLQERADILSKFSVKSIINQIVGG